ncbi:MAG TPA: hypothetical protein IAB22_07370 [Candidatus Merdivicinus intestinavium]|nr:hypothetical protein [Candidatus Merdivicinus intestinavium]
MVFAIILLAAMAFCALKESKVTGLYRTFGVYGRFAAYMSLFCPIGVVMFIASFFTEGTGWAQRGGFLAMAAFGALFYLNALRKCPGFLKVKCIPAMLISGLGLCVKIFVFFIGGVWKLTGPKEVLGADGQVLYLYNHQVYTAGGELVGDAAPDGQSYVKRS